MLELLSVILQRLVGHFTDMGMRTHWMYLLTAFVFAALLHMKRTGTLSGVLGYVFDKDVWLHRSSRVDYKYFVANGLLMMVIVSPLIFLVYPAVTAGTLDLMASTGAPQSLATPVWAKILYAVLAIAIVDFLIFLSHYLQHKVPVLWQFHKVHHAAEVLNPMTLYRQHPVDLLMTGTMVAAGLGLLQGVLGHLFAAEFTIFEIAGLNLVVLAFYLGGYNLRHSHIRLSFGRLDRWLISPEQHQLHHSCVPAHFDRNMGLIFAVWDRLFRTHYLPAPDEEIVLGLPDGESADFSGVLACWFAPFRKILHHNTRAVIALAGSAVVLSGAAVAASDTVRHTPPSLKLEALTWNEVETAMQAGYTRVIIPTGGTEQNGRHVTLGKHNRVIDRTTTDIAVALGDTLIAPVLAYTPENDFHMSFAGTLTLSEETFEAVLRETAESLLGHGFTEVLIIGDSGDSVAAQQRVEDALGERGVRHIEDYYLANGQTEWLLEQGVNKAGIGGHAGIRDTSETMAVAPDYVRKAMLRDTDPNRGANGSHWHASTEIGERMLALKVEAALRQIREEN